MKLILYNPKSGDGFSKTLSINSSSNVHFCTVIIEFVGRRRKSILEFNVIWLYMNSVGGSDLSGSTRKDTLSGI